MLSRGIESLRGNENLKIMVQQISHPDDIDEALRVASERLTAYVRTRAAVSFKIMHECTANS